MLRIGNIDMGLKFLKFEITCLSPVLKIGVTLAILSESVNFPVIKNVFIKIPRIQEIMGARILITFIGREFIEQDLFWAAG